MKRARIPKDLAKVQQKVAFNLTKRQIICFGSGALAGVPLYFILKPVISTSAASLVMVVVMLPFFAFGVYEKNGEPLEVVLRHFIEAAFLRPKKRIYQTENYYALLERQAQLNKEVKAIVRKENRHAADGITDKACKSRSFCERGRSTSVSQSKEKAHKKRKTPDS